MIQQGDKVFIRFDSESDRAGSVWFVENIVEPLEGYPGTVYLDESDRERILTVVFGDSQDESFKEWEVKKFSKLSFLYFYLRENWKNLIKEILAAILIAGFCGLVFFALFTGAKKDEPKQEPKPIDPIIQLGQNKAEIEIKRSEELAAQRDLKKQLEDSYSKVSGYNSEIEKYDDQIMQLVNPKESKLEIKQK